MIKSITLSFQKDFTFVDFSKPVRKEKIVIIPNVSLIARDLTSKSQTKLIFDRLIQIGISKSFIILMNNLPFLKYILTKNFAAGLKLLCELEILYTFREHYLLHNQLVDMAVALNNQQIINYYFSISQKYNFKPGLLTYNLGPFIKFLSSFSKLPYNLTIYCPLNKNNYLMNPAFIDIKEFVNNSHLQFIKIVE